MSFTIKQLANITVVQKATSCSLKEAKQFVSKSKVNLTEASVKEIKKLFLEAKELKWTTNINVKDGSILKELVFFFNEETKELWLEEGKDSIEKTRKEMLDDPSAFSGSINDFKYFVSKLDDASVAKSYSLVADEKPIVYSLSDDKALGELSYDDRTMIDDVLVDDYFLQNAFEKSHRHMEESVTPVQNAKYSLQKGKTSQDEKFNNHFIVVDPDPTIYGVIGKAHMGDDAKYVFISKHPATKKYDRMEFQDFNDASGYAKKVIATLGGTVKLD